MRKRVENGENRPVPGDGPGVSRQEAHGVADEAEEALIVGGVSEADADAGGSVGGPLIQEPGDAGVLAGVSQRMVEAAAAGEGEAAGGKRVPERRFALRGEEHEGLTEFAGGGKAGALGRHVAAGGDLIERHVGKSADLGGAGGCSVPQSSHNFRALAAEDEGCTVFADDRASVFDNTGVSEADLPMPEFDFSACLAGYEDNFGAGGPEAGESGQGRLEGVGVMVQQAVVEVGEDGEHIFTMAGSKC